MIRIILKENLNGKILYHVGPKLIGGNFSLEFLKTGHGDGMFGPGIYFSSNREECLEFFTLYHREPFLYTVQLLDSERIVHATTLIDGSRDWETLCNEIGLADSLKVAKSKGVAGVMAEVDGYDQANEEYCIFDFSVLKILSVESAKRGNHDKAYAKFHGENK